MSVLKVIFYVLLIVATPIVSVFLIRIALKGAKAVDRLAKTLDDARPQMNMILANANRSLTEAETQIGSLSEMAEQAGEMMQRVEAGVTSFQKVVGSPAVRYIAVLSAFLVTSRLFRSKNSGRRRGRG